MRIGINCLQINPSYAGGVNTYTLGLLEGFAAAGNGCRFRLYVTTANQHLFKRFRNRKHFEVTAIENRTLSLRRKVCRAALLSFNKELYKHTCDTIFRGIQREMEYESDIIYTPTVVLQSYDSRKPTVLSMHDIQHFHYPEFFSWQRRLSRKVTYGLSARHASYFQASSQFIKEDLLHHFSDIAEAQIAVIPEGVEISQFSKRNEAREELEQYRLPERFLFCPAQFWPHKNHLTILKALKKIVKEEGLKIPLVLTGARYSAAPQIFDFIKEQSLSNVHYLGVVPFRTLVALYQRAAFLITAVLYESSSLPVLEAAAAGTPIIASRTPPNEEVAHVLRLNLFDPLDVKSLARLLVDIWKDEKAPVAQSTFNSEAVYRYSWENAACKYVQLFERALNL